MGKENPRCLPNDPDCENCPWPDCVATTKDILRQLAWRDKADLWKRDLDILELREKGASHNDIALKYGLSVGSISPILSKTRKKLKEKEEKS